MPPGPTLTSRESTRSQGVADATPLDGVDLLLADLDGVVYQGPDAIPFAVDALNRAAERLRVGYITNNASRTAASVASHLTSLGLEVSASDVVTSPQAAVRLLATLVPTGSRILVVGGEGLTSEVTKAGFVVTDSALDSPAAVVQGFAPEVGWTQLAEASFALHTGIPWVATNTDWTIPVARGIAPGNGTLVSAVHSAVGRLPVVAGKPEVAIFEEAVTRFGATKTLFLGDRLDTDILGANRAGISSALVLTGIDRAKQVLAADKDSRPTFILEDLRQLHEPYPETIETTLPTGDRSFRVGSAVVILSGSVLSIRTPGELRVDLLRAGAAAIWGSGLAIYGLDVPAELHSEG
ncbi:HAD-IIA family hydrolase [Lacisediminihabitans profunda]|uniref:HAD-IIA family hydrolase n=1 Tax=Lacisediminihabitans profunda TaxID=2594790 RepID=A0A5C8UKL7_9MICO|nr:HAD-IIA family hydrolase [Lacisediminihabitans profunda]TXN27963.1 HAD-IIA family hydrolase [Lacisediminihabitans profunda]